MSEIERNTRKIAKKKFIKLRNVDTGVTAYLPNGIDKIKMHSWEDAYQLVSNFDYGKIS